MQCIEKDCKFLLDISSSGLHVFNFLANSILKEVFFAIQNGKPWAFSPGRPSEFLKNYKSSLGFLAYLEGTASSTYFMCYLKLILLHVITHLFEDRKCLYLLQAD